MQDLAGQTRSWKGLAPLAAILIAGGLTAYQKPEPPGQEPADGDWKTMFDGVSLQGWRETPFSGRGKVLVVDGTIVLGTGALTGITWTSSFPKSNYEFRFEAARVAGRDFFAGITFPVGDSHCSWINGGWGGLVVGLSSLDGLDASENDTSIVRSFETGRWYAFRLRVTDGRIQAWIDSEPVVDADLRNRTVSLRPGEIELSSPFGIASYSTTAKLRKLEYRPVPPPSDRKSQQAYQPSPLLPSSAPKLITTPLLR